MITFEMPAWMEAAQIDFGLQKAGVQFRGPFNGTLQGVDFIAERWVASITLPGRKRISAGPVEAFFNQLAGGVNRIRLPHLGSGTRRDPYVPRGTLRGSPRLRLAAVRGDLTVNLENCTVGATLLAGDMVGLGAQLLMVAADAQADGAGQMNLPLVNRIRGQLAIATALVWSRPTATFVMPAMSVRHVHIPAFLAGGQFDMEEAW